MTEISSQSSFFGENTCVWLNHLSKLVQSNIMEVTVEDHQSVILIHTVKFYGRIYIFF